MMNNRHERRRAARLADFRSAGTLEILSPDRLVAKAEADPAFRRSVLQWIDAIPARRPLCVTCEALFRPDHLPVLWHLIKPPRGPVLLAGSCGDCATRFPNDHALMGAVIANYGRATGARLRKGDSAHLHATGGRA